MRLTQAGRYLQVETPLGSDRLVLRSFTGIEFISGLFHYDLELLSEDENIRPEDLAGRNITVAITLADSRTQRYFNGYIDQFSRLSWNDRFSRYRARMVPWLWFLNQTTDCAIFQDKTVPEIVSQVFKRLGFTDFADRTAGNHPVREYCVQYRENTCNFVMRLLEEEGIYFFFEHSNGSHRLVLADSREAHPECPNESTFRWEPSTGSGFHREEDTIHSWDRRYSLRARQWVQVDYNFKTPNLYLISTMPSLISGAPRMEKYDYPGRYGDRAFGDSLTKIRMEEEESVHDVIEGVSDCRSLQSGYRFDLADYPVADQNGRYVLTSVTHSVRQEGFESGEDYEFYYENTFVSIPFSVPFRPVRMARKPVIYGAQTALVVGPKGEEIYTDEHGRVKVQFHWDRDGLFDENSSCWIRVAQPLAGKSWGGAFLPRVGHEVVVSFLEGDPDQPLITGSVYNAGAQPPYKLPGEKTKSTLKTHSSKGGGGFNEIRFEDKKGEEQIFIHAEKDLDLRIKNDRKEWVGRDEHLIVTRDKFDRIDRDAHIAVRRDLIETVERDHHAKVKGKQSAEITGSHSFKVTGDVAEQFSANHSEQCTGSYYLKANSIVIDAGSALTLKVGGNFITINSAGVAIRGTMLLLNSGGAAIPGSPGSLQAALDPTAPLEAVTAAPGEMTTLPNRPGRTFMPFEGSVPATLASLVLTPAAPGRFASASDAPPHQPESEQNRQKKAWIAIRLMDEDESPVSGEPFKITLPDGSVAEGTLDSEGYARVDHIDPGSCKVTFPNLDMEFWEEA